MFKSFETCGLNDISIWLDEVHKQMREYAYTQSPQVRNTIGYIPPNQRINKDNQVESFPEEDSINLYLVTICIFIILALALSIWIWKKKRKI
jgi:hypothetical protein